MSDYLSTYNRVASHDPLRAAGLVAGWIRSDWRPLFAQLRAERPVFVTPAYTLVTKYADVHEVLAHEQVFTVRPTRPQLDAALGSGFMLSRDATALNWRERGLMQVVLDRDDAPAVRELVGRTADELLDAIAAAGTFGGAAGDGFDAVGDLFRPIALRVCEDYFGYRGLEPATLTRWIRAVIKDCYANPMADQAVHAAAVTAGAELMVYVRGALDGRRTDEPPTTEDVFTRLVDTSPPGCPVHGLDQERIAVNAAGLALGFLESGPAAMALATRQLLQRPAVHEAAARAAHDADPAAFDAYVWEGLRLETFFRLMPPRLCEQDYVLAAGTPRATAIPRGALVLPALASAMNDEDVVPEPETFRLGRPAHHHLHFGTGHHHDCLGVHLARVIIPEAVRRLLRRGAAPVLGEDLVFDAIFPERYRLRLA
ncbi:cytochrome P450 [Actinospica durhamensis]|uniref:Cytochrome P450 n=1 Tax=Actinospica durhamensis TaxID=1508375 RepID=A0A941EVG5_9ACTN|nr:cytochrome P450 [Actinospica durhamensis]MBR7837998.1 cytochrome P450 [Actinospica durhamensis]